MVDEADLVRARRAYRQQKYEKSHHQKQQQQQQPSIVSTATTEVALPAPSPNVGHTAITRRHQQPLPLAHLLRYEVSSPDSIGVSSSGDSTRMARPSGRHGHGSGSGRPGIGTKDRFINSKYGRHAAACR